MKRTATVIALAAFILFSALPVPRAQAASASLYLSPSSKTVKVGDSFSVAVYVSTDTAMNAAQATVTFPKDLLQATSVSQSGIFTLWAEAPKYSNTSGTVTFAGGLPNPGYNGKSGKILTITFKARAVGKPKVSITNGSVLANDESATELLRSQGSGTYTIEKATTNTNTTPTNTNQPEPVANPAPVISSDTLPDPNKWYSINSIRVTWTGGNNVRGYSMMFDSSEQATPPETVSTTDTSFSKSDIPDGVWYVHIRARYDTGWSSTTTFPLRVDVTPPEPFTINIIGDPRVEFNAADATSGVDHYELSLDGGAFATVTSPYQTPVLPVGTHYLTVRAYDKAGNYRESNSQFEISGYPQPIIIDLTPVARGNEPIIMRGFANAQDSLRLTIDGVDFGPYPVSEHLDPNSPETPPEGKVAWKIAVQANVSPGEHEVTVVALGPNGEVSQSTVPAKFRIVSNAIRLFGMTIPMVLVINILIILVAVLFLTAGYFAYRYYQLRHRMRHSSVDMLSPAAGGDHRPAKRISAEEADLEQYILDRAKDGRTDQGPRTG